MTRGSEGSQEAGLEALQEDKSGRFGGGAA